MTTSNDVLAAFHQRLCEIVDFEQDLAELASAAERGGVYAVRAALRQLRESKKREVYAVLGDAHRDHGHNVALSLMRRLCETACLRVVSTLRERDLLDAKGGTAIRHHGWRRSPPKAGSH
jgi:hypothetical protein